MTTTTPIDLAPIRLVIGTRNPKKCREMVELLAPPWELDRHLDRIVGQTLAEVEAEGTLTVPKVVEDEETFVGNADKKASEVARFLKRWTLADDSGLSVEALNGAPGVYSARYAGEPTDDQANNRKLLAALESVEDANRGAAFVCALSLADPEGRIRLRAEGCCRGRIAHRLRGEAGFGYDPLFEILELNKTFGELSTLVKHQLSHRARAFNRLRLQLRPMIARVEIPPDC